MFTCLFLALSYFNSFTTNLSILKAKKYYKNV
nr:MAG TPA: hypothetical protein [Caudoviricetes sp.]